MDHVIHINDVVQLLIVNALQVSSIGDTDSAFSTEAEVCPSISSPSPQPVVNGYNEYVANGEIEDSITECEMPKHELLTSSHHSSPLPRFVIV